MSALILPSRYYQPPSGDVEIDWNNPLAYGLTNLIIVRNGIAVDVVNRCAPGSPYGSAKPVGSRFGLSADITAANSAYEFPYTKKLPELTLITKVSVIGTPVTDGGIFGITHSNDSGVAPYVAAFFKYDTNKYPNLTYNIGGSYVTPPALVSTATSAGDEDVYIGRIKSGIQYIAVYRGGKFLGYGSKTISGNPAYGTGPRVVVGEDYRLASRNANVKVLYGAVWSRYLSEGETESFRVNPWQILKPRREILYFGGATGPTHTLTAATSNYTATFNAATLKVSRLLTAATASYATTFQATTLKVSRLLTANTAAYTTVFSAAGLLASRLLTAGMAVYTTTFTAALLLVHRLIAAGTASYTTTVNAANLIYTPIGGATYTLMAEGAAYATTFSAAQLLVSRRLVADAAVYTTAFRPAQLTIGVVSNNSWTPVSGLQSPWGAVSARAPTWTQGVALSTGLWS